MEIRNCTELIVKRDTREYVLHCPEGRTDHEIYGVAAEILRELARIMHENAQKTVPQEVPVDKA